MKYPHIDRKNEKKNKNLIFQTTTGITSSTQGALNQIILRLNNIAKA